MLKKTCKDVVLFPITIYRACLWLPTRLCAERGYSRVGKSLGLLLYSLFGLPLSILLGLEILIVINARLMAHLMDDSTTDQSHPSTGTAPPAPPIGGNATRMAHRPSGHTARL